MLIVDSYQKAALASYFSSSTPKPPTEYTWPANRGYPDISAIGARVLIVSYGAVSIAGLFFLIITSQ